MAARTIERSCNLGVFREVTTVPITCSNNTDSKDSLCVVGSPQYQTSWGLNDQQWNGGSTGALQKGNDSCTMCTHMDNVLMSIDDGTQEPAFQTNNMNYILPQRRVGQQGADRLKNPCKVFVGGVGQGTVESTIRSHFSQYGAIAECVIVTHRKSGKSRGFGFITYDSADAAARAVGAKHKIDDVLVECRQALPKDEARIAAPHDSLYMPTKIFVGGIPDVVEEEDFKKFFSRFGEVIDVSLAYDKSNHRPRGFGFIVYSSLEAAHAAVGRHSFFGKFVEAKHAVPREPATRGPRGGSRRSTANSRATPPEYALSDSINGSWSTDMFAAAAAAARSDHRIAQEVLCYKTAIRTGTTDDLIRATDMRHSQLNPLSGSLHVVHQHNMHSPLIRGFIPDQQNSDYSWSLAMPPEVNSTIEYSAAGNPTSKQYGVTADAASSFIHQASTQQMSNFQSNILASESLQRQQFSSNYLQPVRTSQNGGPSAPQIRRSNGRHAHQLPHGSPLFQMHPDPGLQVEQSPRRSGWSPQFLVLKNTDYLSPQSYIQPTSPTIVESSPPISASLQNLVSSLLSPQTPPKQPPANIAGHVTSMLPDGKLEMSNIETMTQNNTYYNGGAPGVLRQISQQAMPMWTPAYGTQTGYDIKSPAQSPSSVLTLTRPRMSFALSPKLSVCSPAPVDTSSSVIQSHAGAQSVYIPCYPSTYPAEQRCTNSISPPNIEKFAGKPGDSPQLFLSHYQTHCPQLTSPTFAPLTATTIHPALTASCGSDFLRVDSDVQRFPSTTLQGLASPILHPTATTGDVHIDYRSPAKHRNNHLEDTSFTSTQRSGEEGCYKDNNEKRVTQ